MGRLRPASTKLGGQQKSPDRNIRQGFFSFWGRWPKPRGRVSVDKLEIKMRAPKAAPIGVLQGIFPKIHCLRHSSDLLPVDRLSMRFYRYVMRKYCVGWIGVAQRASENAYCPADRLEVRVAPYQRPWQGRSPDRGRVKYSIRRPAEFDLLGSYLENAVASLASSPTRQRPCRLETVGRPVSGVGIEYRKRQESRFWSRSAQLAMQGAIGLGLACLSVLVLRIWHHMRRRVIRLNCFIEAEQGQRQADATNTPP